MFNLFTREINIHMYKGVETRRLNLNLYILDDISKYPGDPFDFRVLCEAGIGLVRAE